MEARVAELIVRYVSREELRAEELAYLRGAISRAELEALATGTQGRGGRSRLLYKLNRIGLVCDPAPECGCAYTPVWVKSHYKMNLARPSIRGVHPIGRATATWDAGANPPFMGELGPNDEFLWVVYRRQRCCTCCE